MKKRLVVLALAALLALSACGKGKNPTEDAYNKKDDSKAEVVVTVAATPVPHAEILKVVEPILKAEGVTLKIQEFTDYVLPNTALNDKQVDANFFQHMPYLETFNKENNMNLVSVAKIHVEPMGAYSKKVKSKDELQDGATVAIPNDGSNEGRALLLLQAQGLIKLKDAEALTQTPKDVVENPKNLKFQEVEAATLPRALDDPKVDFAIINTNYALEAKLNPMSDAIFMEGSESPYANLLVARDDNKDSEGVQKLIKALQSAEVKKFLEDTYKGAVVPAF